MSASNHARLQVIRGCMDYGTAFVNTLLGWYRDGVDVAAKLPALAAYLGHNHPASTYWYFRAVPKLLTAASQ